MLSRKAQISILIVGDVITISLVTGIGFATHGTLETAGSRLLTTFVPLLLAWFAVSPFLGAYEPERALQARQLWRPFWSMVLAGPLAAWLRAVWLNAPILWVFVLVLGGFSALGILAWRALYLLIFARWLASPKAVNG
jgi:hypothetical protein